MAPTDSERSGRDEAKIVFTLLSDPTSPASISRDVFIAQVGAPAVATELGPALWSAFWACSAAFVGAPPQKGARPLQENTHQADAETMPMGVFLRGIASLCVDATAEALLEQLWTMLVPADAVDPPRPRVLAKQTVVDVLSRAFALDTSAAPRDTDAFECAAAAAVGFAAGAVFDDPGLSAARAFAMWAVRDLPSLCEVLSGHLEARLASPQAVDAAMALNAERGAQPPTQLTLQELLMLDSDSMRRQLMRAARQPATAEAAAAEGGRPAPAVAGVEHDTALLAGDEWLWLIRLALSLRGCGQQPAVLPTSQQGGWACLFSSRQHGRSLHTLVDRIEGYGAGAAGVERGQLLLCADGGGHVFGCWADQGLHPTPGVDYFGGEGSALLRLKPSFLVCRSQRRLSRMRAQPGARGDFSEEAAAEPVQLRAATAATARRRGEPAKAAPTDANYCLCNNRRGQRRGLGMGGTLHAPRLWLAPSLETGSATSACDTFADGVLASAAEFSVAVVEVWGCGGAEARRAQLDWRWSQSDQKKRQLRGFLRSELDTPKQGVVDGLGKEDRWIFGLLNFTSKFAQRDAY